MINVFNLFRQTLKKSYSKTLSRRYYLSNNKSLLANNIFELVIKQFAFKQKRKNKEGRERKNETRYYGS
jgi:hypothetical protein